MNSFALKITKNRKKLGFTKKTVANLVQCSETYIGNIENKGVVPEDEIVIRLANALNLNERDLLLLAHKVKAPRGAKQYFEAPRATYPQVRRYLLDRCGNRETMSEEFSGSAFSTIEKFIARNILYDPLQLYSRVREEPGQRVEPLEFIYELLISGPQTFADYLSVYERELTSSRGNSKRFMAGMQELVQEWTFDAEVFRLSVMSDHAFVRRDLSFARETLGQYIEYHRQQSGLSIEDVSRRAQIVPAALERIEKDDYPLELKLETIGHILLAIGIGQQAQTDEKYTSTDYRLLETYKRLSTSSRKEIDSFMSYKLSEEDLADL
jgi:transcriptional regulator with XRE-family HTH domain